MTNSIDSIGVLMTNNTCTGWAFSQGQVAQIAMGTCEEKILKQLQSDPPVPVFVADIDSVDFVSTPANIIPENLSSPAARHSLCAIAQTSPADILSAPSRLRIAGFLAQNENWDGVVLLLDQSLSQWVQISANEVVSFQSFLTGKLAALLDVPHGTIANVGAIAQTMDRPERITSHLRSAEIQRDPAAAIGHLIGAEISAARPYWLGQQIAIISDIATPQNWSEPLVSQGVPLIVEKSQSMTVAGFVGFANS